MGREWGIGNRESEERDVVTRALWMMEPKKGDSGAAPGHRGVGRCHSDSRFPNPYSRFPASAGVNVRSDNA